MSVLSNSTKQVLQNTSSLSMEIQDDNTIMCNKKKQEKNIGSNGISNAQRVWTSLLSGAIAGALAKTTIAPLDRTKINFQISNQPFSAKAAIKFLIKTFRTEGLLSLWRGNSATMVRIVPYSAVQFTAHEQWKRILGVNGSEREKPGLNFLAGSLAGITSQGTTYPLDLMRARMAVTQKTKYKTLRQIFVRIYMEEGIAAYYRGFTATLLGVIPYAGCSFFTYDLLRNLLTVYTVAIPGFSTSLICGAIAGMVAQTSSYPLDIIRRRMQTSAMHGQHYHTIRSTIIKIYKEEGIMAFYKGLSMNWIKGPIAVGISFATHDTIRDTLRKIIICQNTSLKT
ncbi:mitochondrial coenzyme A transporter SLC25A42 [Apis mellifera caucasica]|uniref:Mitochondrial coenzyme A transporter SLC25A42 n=1 Tax=Apis mellifera TaxID=7460 RepID=A0A7M7R6K6_APIME|nr:mitochondrial coenzyme A transporter SLC25A42 [Apis mellifera]XP_396993.3 mitochondrial coenzyme A transporter SLC25A42 [Apis mellifera]KAG6795462.1 mitochondrial coenzyme A transporter SLC25A42 [Apis mellifera caucasica]KAG9438195.1 mitochondrial coenzyme A transporter SLC25A42 [Apis mellifera carnica]|eukprot:XP_016770770.1 mitochondrial coenzyme A transporter SLC25A42 [Apis mellifera]